MYSHEQIALVTKEGVAAAWDEVKELSDYYTDYLVEVRVAPEGMNVVKICVYGLGDEDDWAAAIHVVGSILNRLKEL